MVSSRKKKAQNKMQFGRLDDTLNDFVGGNGTTVKTIGNEALESQPKAIMKISRGLLTVQY